MDINISEISNKKNTVDLIIIFILNFLIYLRKLD
mgnify:CR=1 FL=1